MDGFDFGIIEKVLGKFCVLICFLCLLVGMGLRVLYIIVGLGVCWSLCIVIEVF